MILVLMEEDGFCIGKMKCRVQLYDLILNTKEIFKFVALSKTDFHLIFHESQVIK